MSSPISSGPTGNTNSIVLVVDDEPRNLRIIREHLEDQQYSLVLQESGDQALQWLNDPNHLPDVVLLDRMMPGLSGMDVLKRLKQLPRLSKVPVIMQTAMDEPQAVVEGIRAGAFYYLTKPFDLEVLSSVVAAALESAKHRQVLLSRLERVADLSRLLATAHFRIRTLDEAADLAAALAVGCRDAGNAALGVAELLINAIEHGNLGLGYEEKSALIAAGEWREEIDRRLGQASQREKFVDVFLERGSDSVMLRIKDQGKGFDWNRYLEFDPSRAFDVHGRGIAVANAMASVQITYVGNGSEVNVVLATDSARL